MHPLLSYIAKVSLPISITLKMAFIGSMDDNISHCSGCLKWASLSSYRKSLEDYQKQGMARVLVPFQSVIFHPI